MDGKYGISTAAPSATTPTYATLWDYFVHLCDDVLAPKLGVTLSSGQHLYSDNLSSGFRNSQMPLDAIHGEGHPSTSLRDIFGYIAQLAGGVIVFRPAPNNQPYCVVDIVSFDLSTRALYNGGTFVDAITTSFDGGTFDVQSSYTPLVGGSLGSDNIPILKSYQSQSLTYGESRYTKVSLTYPTSAGNEETKSYGRSDDNILALYNPLAQASTSTLKTDRATRVQNIYTALSYNVNSSIKPFSGKYKNDVLAEILDNVIVQDMDGHAYNSFIGGITYNYLGTTDISNSTPTDVQNKSFSI